MFRAVRALTLVIGRIVSPTRMPARVAMLTSASWLNSPILPLSIWLNLGWVSPKVLAAAAWVNPLASNHMEITVTVWERSSRFCASSVSNYGAQLNLLAAGMILQWSLLVRLGARASG